MKYNASVVLYGILVSLMSSSCNTNDSVKEDVDDIDEGTVFVNGAWNDRTNSDSLYDTYFFNEDNQYNRISRSVGKEWAYGGEYSVTDSMIRMTEMVNGTPFEEIWIRFRNHSDSMTVFKGLQLTGMSNRLIGEWYCESKVVDSSGRKLAAEYVFTADSLFIIKTNTYMDTSRFVETSDGVVVYEKTNASIKYVLLYEINENRLSIYNQGTKRIWTRETIK